MDHEIEIRSLLSKEQYDFLKKQLPQKMQLINQETIHTIAFTPNDLRLRYSDKTFEIVCKEKDPTKKCRKELTIPLSSKSEIEKFSKLFEMMNLKQLKPWTNHKMEFKYNFNNYIYTLSLQHIENFAYILEVEYLDKENTTHIHEPNIHSILKQFNLKPIDPKDFTERIKKYHK